MVIEAETKPDWGGHRGGAGRPTMYQGYPNTEQKRISIPVEFWEAIQQEYSDERGRNWASYGVYDILKEWYEKREIETT